MPLYAPHIPIAQKNAAAYPILMAIAEKMCDKNLDYYSHETIVLMKQLEDKGHILLVSLKSPDQSILNGYGISDLTKEQASVLVLFAAEIARNGDLPYPE